MLCLIKNIISYIAGDTCIWKNFVLSVIEFWYVIELWPLLFHRHLYIIILLILFEAYLK